MAQRRRKVSGRSYLSIGDVLTLLRQEFPDITISKIRFLESQGLVNPERTPSGYRKFYDADVERLRWVLRQQREHFLPLKVIKDRLDGRETERPGESLAESPGVPARRPAAPVDVEGSAELVEVGAVPSPAGAAAVETRAHAGAAAPVGAPAHSVTGLAAATAPGRVDAPGPVPAAGSPGPRGSDAGGAPRNGGPRADTPAVLERRPPIAPTSGPAPGGPAPGGDRGAGTGSSGASGSHPGGAEARPEREGSAPPPSVAPPPASPGPGTFGAAPSEGTTSGVPPTAPEPAAGGGPVPLSPTRPAGGVGLTADELAVAAGADPAVVSQLREYGLMAPVVLGGVEYFDEGALAVAKLAASFAAYGIEPRHLRLYKHAAERESGFIEQVVLPLLRQRNPESRGRAATTAAELARLGQALRSELVRQALGALLGHDAVQP